MKTFLVATRPSTLARRQTQWVIQALERLHPNLSFMEHVITTKGDRELDKPLPLIGGKGLFTQELEAALLSSNVQAAVHSLKDLPVQNPAQLMVGAIPQRGDSRDVLISAQGFTLRTLPLGAVIGTSSLRRAAQVLALRPDVQIKDLRGNIDTRLRKALSGNYDAVLLSLAGLQRMGLEEYVTEILSFDEVLPAPGQGALAVQCRADDVETLQILAELDHIPTRRAVTAERAFLEGLGGGCSVPVGAYGEVLGDDPEGELSLRTVVLALDGKRKIALQKCGSDPVQVGQELAEEALRLGARKLLEEGE